ncbi:Uncharacterised protein [uncultured archaeon]|nr:Uncharacterised protein [uncultured archaeon]
MSSLEGKMSGLHIVSCVVVVSVVIPVVNQVVVFRGT